MITKIYNVTFEPLGKTVRVKEGSTVLDAAISLEIPLYGACGGIGKCMRCKVRIDGEECLACQKLVDSDITVDIHPESLIDVHQILTASRTSKLILDELQEINPLVEDIDTLENKFGVALDIGTTTVVLQILELSSGELVESISDFNPQITYGVDVLSRMLHAEKRGIDILQKLIIDKVNKFIDKIAKNNQIDIYEIVSLVASGNATMNHIFMGLDPSCIRIGPHLPKRKFLPDLHGRDLNLDINPDGIVYATPNLSGYVGGDIISDILACNLHKDERLSLLIDVGTNGEVVLGNKDWIVACSSSAGSAFEGTDVSFGTIAKEGAIERVWVNENGSNVEYSVLGDKKPIGLCGSGLIDLVAEMFMCGVVDKKGNITDIASERIIESGAQKKFIVAYKEETQDQKDITISETDIANIIRTKGAIFAATKVLVNKMGLKFEDISRICLSGAFGSYINLKNAVTIGMYPDLPFEKYDLIGNGSLIGARMLLMSKTKLSEPEEILAKSTYIDLSTDQKFMDEFSSSLFLPHTDIELFPTVKKSI